MKNQAQQDRSNTGENSTSKNMAHKAGQNASPEMDPPRSDSYDKQFLMLAENATDLVYTMDMDQRITYMSPSVKQILGYEVDEVLKLRGSALLTRESYQRQVDAFRDFLAHADDYSKQTDLMDLKLVRKDGTEIWGEAHARLMLDENRQPVGIFGICRDITHRKKAEEREHHYRQNAEWLHHSAMTLMELPTEKAILQYIGESLHKMIPKALIIVAAVDEEEQVVIPRYFHGLGYNRLQKVFRLLGVDPVGRRYALSEYLAGVYREQKIIPFEGGLRDFSRGYHRDGILHKIEQLLNLKKIYTIGLKRNNRLLSAIHILKFNQPELSDIRFLETFLHQASIALQRKILENELRQAKEKAEESERLKTAFLGNMSHEIRTPLNIMLGYIQMFEDTGLSQEEKKSYIRAIHQSSDQLLDIINDILSMSKLEAGQQKPQPHKFNLNSLLQEIFTNYEVRAHRNNLGFHYHTPLPGEKSVVWSDETKIRQILNNLLSNAFKFTNRGSVEIGYRLRDHQLELYVSDTGVGIPESHHDKIFERFTQVENPGHRKYEGTGLGLSISQALAGLLGGEMKVESREDRGTTFYFLLPASCLINPAENN